jgi:ATP-dependent DNA helicase RecG
VGGAAEDGVYLPLTEQLGDITESGVKYHLAKMKREGLICRVGPDKGGHWEVLK